MDVTRNMLLSVAALMLTACSTESDLTLHLDDPPHAETTEADNLITRKEYGDAWPFTLDELQLFCLQGAVIVSNVDTGDSYPINGVASGRADTLRLFPLEQIWRDNPEIAGTKVSVGPLIERGLTMCE